MTALEGVMGEEFSKKKKREREREREKELIGWTTEWQLWGWG